MKNKNILLLVTGLLLISVTAVAYAEDLRVLVSPFANHSQEEYGWVGFGIEASVISDLASIPQIKVIGSADRKRALEELSYQMSGSVAEDMIVQAGSMLGANIILTGEYTVLNEEIRLTARLSLVETSTVISSIKLNGMISEIFGLQDKIVVQLFRGIDKRVSGGIEPIILTNTQIAAIHQRDENMNVYQYRAKELEINEGVPQEFLDIERTIFEAINSERNKAGIRPLLSSPKLSSLSRYHAMNMQVYNFFEFVDQNGMNSMGRKQMMAPELFGPATEVIAWSYKADSEGIADTIMNQWMSGEAKEVILNPDFNYAGLGVFRGDGEDIRYYCSLIPASLMVELVSTIPKRVTYGSEIELVFRFIGDYPKEEVGIVVRYPDRLARFKLSGSSFYEGYGIYKPVSWNGDFFTVKIRCDKGQGAYVLQPARGENFYPFGVTFISR